MCSCQSAVEMNTKSYTTSRNEYMHDCMHTPVSPCTSACTSTRTYFHALTILDLFALLYMQPRTTCTGIQMGSHKCISMYMHTLSETCPNTSTQTHAHTNRHAQAQAQTNTACMVMDVHAHNHSLFLLLLMD